MIDDIRATNILIHGWQVNPTFEEIEEMIDNVSKTDIWVCHFVCERLINILMGRLTKDQSNWMPPIVKSEVLNKLWDRMVEFTRLEDIEGKKNKKLIAWPAGDIINES